MTIKKLGNRLRMCDRCLRTYQGSKYSYICPECNIPNQLDKIKMRGRKGGSGALIRKLKGDKGRC